MRNAILVVGFGALALVLASFTRVPALTEPAPLASISHLDLLLASSGLPEAEPSSTF
jgi:phosphoribosylcarboxyaminoimidazole (NCAIR) mutase